MSGAVVLPLCAGLLAACVSDGPSGESAAETTPAVIHHDPADLRAELLALAKRVSADHGGRVGIAVATGEEVVHVGLTGNSFAWSTVKVPVAVVADRKGVATPELIAASISNSDNAAAYQLSWSIDHDLEGLAHAPELEPLPGETFWPLPDQALFAAQLPCVDTEGTTYDSMADIVDWQQYGLANIDGAHFKGGWGLDTPRVYALRQLGTVPVEGGLIGVALITHPDDADHDTGVEILDALSLGLAKLIDAGAIAPATSCGP